MLQGLHPKSPWSWPPWKSSPLRLGGRCQSVPQPTSTFSTRQPLAPKHIIEFCIKKTGFLKRLLLVTATRLASTTSRRHTEANIKIHIIQDQKQRPQSNPTHTRKSLFQPPPAHWGWWVGLEHRTKKQARSLLLALPKLQTLLSSGPLKKGVGPSLEALHWLRPHLSLSFSFCIK